MRTAQQRKEAICWVLRHMVVGDCEPGTLAMSGRQLGRLTGLPRWLVFFYTRELIQAGLVRNEIASNGSYAYYLARD